MRLTLEHLISLVDLRAHLVDVETTLHGDDALPSPLTLFMPVWSPGSYLVREYARHVEGLECLIDGATAPIWKVRKNAWRCDPAGAKSVVVRYRLYCNELTVRTNHIDGTHAFLNGAATFLAVEGHEDARAIVEISAPEGSRIATSLNEVPSRRGRRAFEAPDLDVLVDCPIEIGRHRDIPFDVLGVPHRLIVCPENAANEHDLERIITHTRTLLETEAAIFGGRFPYDRYLIQLHLTPRGRGGLEHMSSCALLAPQSALATRDGYLDLLSLIAHEVFHAWNVKRIRPAGLTPYRYEEENYTRLLWWFEGGTSYFDWRVLRLANLCTVPEYLAHLADEIAYLDTTHGRFLHSLEDASFDAWIKLYRPDENSANSTVSYYRKGEVVCALLDLEIRFRSEGRSSLDDVMRYLWEHFGMTSTPVPEDGLQAALETATGAPLGDLFDAWIRAPGEIDYVKTLAHVGLAIERHCRADSPRCSLSMRLRNEGGGHISVISVTRGGAAQRAGIDPGDEVVAIAGHTIEGTNLDAALSGRSAGDRIEITVARDGRLLHRVASLDGPRLDRVRLVPRDAGPTEQARFRAWLAGPHPSWDT